MLLNYKGLDYRTEWVGQHLITNQPELYLTTPQLEYPNIRPTLEPQSVPPFLEAP
jgi:hypothetical protein